MGRQTRLEIIVSLYGNPMSNDFRKTSLLKIQTLGTGQRILKTKIEEGSCARKHPVAF